jgi:predicted ATP-binding protein involved in virulence
VIYGGDSCVLCKAGFAGRMKKAQAEAERAREVIENDALAQIELFKQEKAAYEVYVAQLAANNARFKANIQAQIKELLEEVGIEGGLE